MTATAINTKIVSDILDTKYSVQNCNDFANIALALNDILKTCKYYGVSYKDSKEVFQTVLAYVALYFSNEKFQNADDYEFSKNYSFFKEIKSMLKEFESLKNEFATMYTATKTYTTAIELRNAIKSVYPYLTSLRTEKSRVRGYNNINGDIRVVTKKEFEWDNSTMENKTIDVLTIEVNGNELAEKITALNLGTKIVVY